MTYRSLGPHLEDTANEAKLYFETQFGVTKIRIEDSVEADVSYRPTLVGTSRDHHIVCVEVTDGSFTDALDAFVLDCIGKHLPVKLWIAVPPDFDNSASFGPMIKHARKRNVGLIQINGGQSQELSMPISLSLAGVRGPRREEFPKRYRQALSDAETTFRNGDPVKGCSRVYDELEDLTRRIAKKVERKGWWTAPPGVDFEKGAWAMVLKALRDKTAQALRTLCPDLTDILLSRVIGMTEYRNEANHKPTSRKKLVERDRKLRTRFESAVDTLHEVINASKPLRP